MKSTAPTTPLLERRRLAGYSQEKLAALAGLSQARISRLEHGREEGTRRSWQTLAEALGCDVREIRPWQ